MIQHCGTGRPVTASRIWSCSKVVSFYGAVGFLIQKACSACNACNEYATEHAEPTDYHRCSLTATFHGNHARQHIANLVRDAVASVPLVWERCHLTTSFWFLMVFIEIETESSPCLPNAFHVRHRRDIVLETCLIGVQGVDLWASTSCHHHSTPGKVWLTDSTKW